MSEVTVEGTSGYYTDPTLLSEGAEAEGLSLLLEPTGGSLDALAELEILLVQMNVEERGEARDQNTLEEQSIQEAGERHIAALHDQADAALLQATIAGIGQIAGGALSAYGGASGLAADAPTEASSLSQQWGGLGQLASGGGQLGAELFGGGGVKDAQADAAAAQTAQASAERGASQASTEYNAAQDDLRGLLGQLQRIHDAELAAQNAAIFMA